MTDYIPNDQEVRQAYAQNYVRTVEYHEEGFAEFDRWLQKVKAEAWAEAIYHVEPLIGLFTRRSMMQDNPYES